MHQNQVARLNYSIACGFKLHRDLDPGGDGYNDEPSIWYVLVNCIIKIKSEQQQQQQRRLQSKIKEIHNFCVIYKSKMKLMKAFCALIK